MDSLLAALGVKKFSIALAGAVGGLISLRHYNDLSLPGKVIVILSSMALANYATPAVAAYFGSSAADYELGIAAAIGLFGLSIISSVTSLMKDIDLWKSLITRAFGRE